LGAGETLLLFRFKISDEAGTRKKVKGVLTYWRCREFHKTKNIPVKGKTLMPDSNTNKEAARTLVTNRTYESINEVTLTGAVVHMFAPEGRDLVVLTLATNAGRNRTSNYPKITWYGEKAKKIAADLKVEPGNFPRVCIKATVQTSKKGEGDRTTYFQTIVGTELSYAPKQLEGRLNMDIGNRYIEDENEVILVGEIVHIYHFGSNGGERQTGSILTVKTRISNWANFPKVTMFRRLSDTANKMKEGDIVAITGIIQTNKVERTEKKPDYYETIVGTDLDWYRE